MPSKTLPTLSRAEIASHNTSKSCYVTLGNNVYDVTDFLDSHPGGAELVLEYAGKDIADILRDKTSHPHSDAAYEVLDESLVGYIASDKVGNGSATNGKATGVEEDEEVARFDSKGRPVHPKTGMSCEEDLSKDTDFDTDYKTHKFLDLSRPLFPQIWYGGFTKEFYLDQVHRPRHYKGGESAPLFGNFLEPLTKTPWWLVPIMWLPPMFYGLYVAREGIDSAWKEAALWAFGFSIWSLLEYILHRFLFHLDYYLPDNRVGISLHFVLHGIHHYLPMDRYRLVMPPTLFVFLAFPFWKLAHAIFWSNWSMGTAAFCGGITGYISYDLTHYFLHHQNLPLWYKQLKKYHLQHHFLDFENGFGVTTKFWDRVFGTELAPVIKAN